jgi:hypothetical protein
MSDPRGVWPLPQNYLAAPDIVHAFGQITLAYNAVASLMERIFVFQSALEQDYAQRLFHKLNNRDFPREFDTRPVSTNHLNLEIALRHQLL